MKELSLLDTQIPLEISTKASWDVMNSALAQSTNQILGTTLKAACLLIGTNMVQQGT